MPTDQRHPLGVTEAPEPRSARQTINDMLDAGLLDELMDRVDAGELTLTGEGGFLPEMVKAAQNQGLLRWWRSDDRNPGPKRHPEPLRRAPGHPTPQRPPMPGGCQEVIMTIMSARVELEPDGIWMCSGLSGVHGSVRPSRGVVPSVPARGVHAGQVPSTRRTIRPVAPAPARRTP